MFREFVILILDLPRDDLVQRAVLRSFKYWNF